MTINLEDYLDLAGDDPHVRDTLQESFAEAARVMTPQGLGNYLEGARGLVQLGRGNDLVISYLQSMPLVAKEVGEEVVKDVVHAALRLSSLVSGEIIALMFSSLPTAASRLADEELLRGYLGLLHQLAAKAPRGLRPMLTHLDELFSKLTLGGLRRWALWGAEAHGRDFQAQTAYFGLESADSQAVLQKERRGTLFVDSQRRLNFYLRALWGRDFFMRPTSGDYETAEGYKPFIEQRVLHLPDAYDDLPGIPGKEIYRAVGAHLAAHLVYGTDPISAEALTPVQMAFIGLVEDARVEQLAIGEFPGLKALWLGFHQNKPERDTGKADPVVDLLERAAWAMLDETRVDPDPWVMESAEDFRRGFAQTPQDNQISWDLGVTMLNRLAGRAAVPSLRVLEGINIPYRDDNRYIWAFDENTWREADYVSASHKQVRKTVSLMDMWDELDCELAGDDAQEIWILESEFFRDGDPVGVSLNQLEGREPVSQPFHYHEWDYQVQLHRPDWVTVLEKRQKAGDPAVIDNTLVEYRPVATRLKHIIDALQPAGVVRQRNREDGDEIDINAAIRAMVDLRCGQTPDPRINIRTIRKTRDLAVVVLLDLSESTNETLPGTDRPVLQLAREATGLLAWAMDAIGDPLAIHGFASDGRHDVQYFRVKDFGHPWDDHAKGRLAGLKGGLSTRMGGALRHAAMHLGRQPQRKKLILLVSDGEPADIDIRDPQYLRQDTKKAVEELSNRGIMTYCLTLDPEADEYVSRIFGPRGFTVVDHVQKLPEKLPLLFASLTS
ncbi:MAG: nitric oxide reductase activation protein NorD [Deltaproteobacteria bacterium]|nr:nitric oxide reductase activation protein NorD [Deltaproteobacteria bacterium]